MRLEFPQESLITRFPTWKGLKLFYNDEIDRVWTCLSGDGKAKVLMGKIILIYWKRR